MTIQHKTPIVIQTRNFVFHENSLIILIRYYNVVKKKIP